ncbi:MAG: hypothetical protein JO105_21815 [Hyphomicrobiales bacterium]|nr:hypothetical protein [Hyphomicrobiales bacterium]
MSNRPLESRPWASTKICGRDLGGPGKGPGSRVVIHMLQTYPDEIETRQLGDLVIVNVPQLIKVWNEARVTLAPTSMNPGLARWHDEQRARRAAQREQLQAAV